MYKLEICQLNEAIGADGFCTGDYYDQGIVDTVCAPTLKELLLKLQDRWSLKFIKSLEVYEDRLEGAIENKEGGVLECYSLYISYVEETPVNPSIVLGFLQRKQA